MSPCILQRVLICVMLEVRLLQCEPQARAESSLVKKVYINAGARYSIFIPSIKNNAQIRHGLGKEEKARNIHYIFLRTIRIFLYMI